MIVFLNKIKIDGINMNSLLNESGEFDFNSIIYSPSQETNQKKWGVKTNASKTFIFGDTLFFITYERIPLPIVKALSETYKENKITHTWASDEIGCKVGKQELLSGEIITDISVENLSQEALDIYVNVWGNSQCLYKDNNQYKIKDCIDCDGCCGAKKK